MPPKRWPRSASHARSTSSPLTAPASLTELPVFGVPIESKALAGVDSLYSIVQMPAGVPVGTLAIGKPGAINAALLAASVLALNDPALSGKLAAWRKAQTEAVGERPEGTA